MDNEIRGGKENILPDAAGLFYALRSMGYENTAAVADLIDNSIDAKASNIWVTVDEGLDKIFIADDGIGMSDTTLNTAIKLGGKKAHDKGSDLGKYGLGLITASLSMGRVIRIITKKDGMYNTAVLDYDEIRKTNLFNADFHESTKAEIDSFNYRTNSADSGTVLIIDKCDKLQYTKAKDLINAIEKSISEVFHIYLSEGKCIYINGAEIAAYDPLLLAVRGNKPLVDKDITIKSTSGIEGTMHVLAVKIPDQGTKANRSLGLNIKGQGFYILRNKREIASALEFPEIFSKHNDFNLLRIELSFDPDLDDLMGINLKKHDVAPSKEVIRTLKDVLNGPIRKVREEIKEKQKKKEENNPFISPTIPPKEEGGTVTTPTQTGETISSSTGVYPYTPVEKKYEIAFSTYVDDENGPLFKSSISDRTITIYYNLCNKYYSERVLADEHGTSVKEALDDVIKASLEAYLELSGTASTVSLFVDKLQGFILKTE